MQCSCRRVFDGLAIALLVFVIACELRGAIAGSARVLSVVVSIVCILCGVGLYKDIQALSESLWVKRGRTSLLKSA